MIKKAYNALKTEGLGAFVRKSGHYFKRKWLKNRKDRAVYKDILFIGDYQKAASDLWQCEIACQKRKLETCWYFVDETDYRELKVEQAGWYRAFVVFGCPDTDQMQEFVKTVKELNKTVFYVGDEGMEEKDFRKKDVRVIPAGHLAESLKREIKGNYVFVLPGLQISGGVKVVLKHASILRKAGKEVVIFVLSGSHGWCRFDGIKIPVINLENACIAGKIGHMIATMWTTVKTVEDYPYAEKKYYLVQNLETDFYKEGDPLRGKADRSYTPEGDIRFLTISKWCQSWLKEKYGQDALYAPNGLEVGNFVCRKRKMEGKIRILIEGDCAVDYKNVDEAFEVTNSLDKAIYEVWYMSYNAQPKQWYQVDRFCHRIPYDQVPEIYGECDILLKTSLLESFSYPPLEMMASGGYVVAIPNDGNREYLEDGKNCLFYSPGDLEGARGAIEKIRTRKELQDNLYENGRITAQKRNWHIIEEKILLLYDIEEEKKARNTIDRTEAMETADKEDTSVREV